ncbi:hypothetical protein D9M71_805030 [compost metagenome]
MLREEIEKISGDGPGSVNDRLEELNEQLQEQIGNLVDALEYNPEQPAQPWCLPNCSSALTSERETWQQLLIRAGAGE